MGVPEELWAALDSVIGNMVTERTAVAFSGGLDSGVIAAMAAVHGTIKLYTVGTEGSYDVKASQELASEMGLEWEHIVLTEENLEPNLLEMMKITRTVNPITLSFEIPLFYVTKYCSEDVILSGQGADEIFAGYAKYEDLSESDLRDQMNKDMIELMMNTVNHEKKVAEHFGKEIRYPYLDRSVTDIVGKIDIKDLAPREVRKAFLRDVAHLIDQPEIAAKPKKAAQYGSGTMDTLRKMAKRKGTTVNGLISMMSEGL